jgi:prepilin-type N-terminal cleavage/methylation domain-containing protein
MQSSIFNYKKFAFSLAEILIALVVIGVIAAITMPVIYTSYQKKLTETKVKKVYSTLNQAMIRARSDYGPASSWDWSDHWDSGTSPTKWINTYLKPYLNTSDINVYKMQYPLSEARYNCNARLRTNLVLNDGTTIHLQGGGYDWSSDPWVWIVFDINGIKGPNKVGRDIFSTYFYADKGFSSAYWVSYHRPFNKYPREEAIAHCKNNCMSSFCLELIRSNNWQIPNDYPW